MKGEMDDNYAALIVSILIKVEPEKAFSLIGLAQERRTPRDSRIMARYRQEGYTADAIAHWYGIGPNAVEKRISRYRAALGG